MAINGTVGDDFNLVSFNDGDEIYGLEGGDTLTAVNNNVTLYGGSGNDVLISSEVGANSTTMDGGSGDDVLAGGGTNDTASYANDPARVVVDLSNNSAIDGTGGTDTLVGIENVTGSAFGDSLTGDVGANVLQGGAGNDTLAGGLGADVFKYSFTQTSGQGSTSTFTDWLSDKYGKDFGDELPDFSPKHNSRDNHCGDDRHDAPASGLTEKFFEQNYKEWLKEVVVVDLQEQGFVLDKNGDGKIKVDINDDSRNGTPRIEGLTKHQLDGIFGDRDSVILNDHGEAEKAWYSNSFTSGQGKDTVASTDGFDTIVDFKWGEDHLEFHGLGAGFTLAQFTNSFDVTQTDMDHNGTMDTVLSLADHTWAVTLLDVSAPHTEADFHATSVFS